MAAKTKLAVLTALLSLAATAQVLAPASAAAMDDNGPQCTLTVLGGVPVLLDPEGNICDPASGAEEIPVGDVYYVEDTKPKTEPPPNPRADGCYFGCLKKDTRRPQGRDSLVGFPGEPKGKGGKAGKGEAAKKAKGEAKAKGETSDVPERPSGLLCSQYKGRLFLSDFDRSRLGQLQEQDLLSSLRQMEIGHRFNDVLRPERDKLSAGLARLRGQSNPDLQELSKAESALADVNLQIASGASEAQRLLDKQLEIGPEINHLSRKGWRQAAALKKRCADLYGTHY